MDHVGMVLSILFMIIGFGCVSLAVYKIEMPMHVDYDSSEVEEIKEFESHMFIMPDKIGVISINIEANTTPSESENEENMQSKTFEEGAKLGSLEIPILNSELPLVQGTSPQSLKSGVGHFTESVMPGAVDNCVISGHRDTYFRKIGKLKIGDELIVKTEAGMFTYKVTGTQIVHRNDKTIIVPTDRAVLTLTTCYPFQFIGHAPDRYIVSADLVQ